MLLDGCSAVLQQPWLHSLGHARFRHAAFTVRSAFLGENPAFSFVSGVTAPKEQCLVVEGGNVDVKGARLLLESCQKAAKAGDGRELFGIRTDGQVHTLLGGLCVARAETQDPEDQGDLALADCDAVGKEGISFHPTPGNRWHALHLKEEDDNDRGEASTEVGTEPLCLSLGGSGTPGEENVSRGAQALASSTIDKVAHDASLAVDGHASTYWASDVDPQGPVTFEVGLFAPRILTSIDIDWECPARDFSVKTLDGTDWVEHASQGENGALHTHIPLQGVETTAVQIEMRGQAPQCGNGALHAFAMREVKLNGPKLRPVIEPCTASVKSADARSRWFLQGVSQFSPCTSRIRKQVPQFL